MKKNKGVSLIVLVITIIVMIILSTSIVLSISNSGVIEKANEGSFKNDLKAAQEELSEYIMNQSLNDDTYDSTLLYASSEFLEYNGVRIKDQDIFTIMPSLSSSLGNKLKVTRGALYYIGESTNDDQNWPVSEADALRKEWALEIGVNAKTQLGYDYANKRLLSSDWALSFIENGVLQIPDEPLIQKIGANAYYNVSGLTKVILSSNVTTIETDAFRANTSLTTVDLKAGTLSTGNLSAIGANAFYGCTKLADADLPESLVTIGTYAFYNCYNLKISEIPDSVTSIGTYAFYNCDGITSLNLPDEITTINSATFNHCSNLKTIDWPSGLKTIASSAFSNCASLEGESGVLVIPEGVTSIGDSAFYNCKAITEVVLPSTLKTLSANAFNGCSNLTKINIPASVTSIGANVFANCTNLTDITYEGGNFVVDNGIVYNANKTELISLLKTPTGTVIIPSTVTTINTATLRTIAATASIEIADGNTKYATDNGSIYIKDNNGNLINLVLYNGTGTSYTAPSTLTSITAYAFNTKGSSLTSIDLSGTSITTIPSYTFNGCSKVTSIKLNNSITTLSTYAFTGLSKVTSIKLPSSVTSLTSHVFNGCSALKSITVSANVTSIHALFGYNSGITSVVFEAGSNFKQQGDFILTSDGKTLVWLLGNTATSVTVPNGVETIQTYAFYYKTKLQSVTLPNTIKTIQAYAFDSSSLQSITIPNSIQTIANYAFSRCSSLMRISIDKTEDSITNSPWGAPYGLRIVEWMR